jgi:hypothetical protein
VDSDPKTLDSFRVELEAIRSLVYFLRLIIRTQQLRPPDNWRVKIWIDNASALDKSGLEEIMTPTLHLGPETDIISDILAVKKEIGLTIDGKCVKSHQVLDKDKEVPLEVQLNEDCDENAKDFLRNAVDKWKTRPMVSAQPNAVVTLHIDALVITNHYRDHLKDAWTGKNMCTYIC